MTDITAADSHAEVAPVAIVMGSRSDWPGMQAAARALDEFGVAWQAEVVSAHRTPDRMHDFAKGAIAAGVQVVIAGSWRRGASAWNDCGANGFAGYRGADASHRLAGG